MNFHLSNVNEFVTGKLAKRGQKTRRELGLEKFGLWLVRRPPCDDGSCRVCVWRVRPDGSTVDCVRRLALRLVFLFPSVGSDGSAVYSGQEASGQIMGVVFHGLDGPGSCFGVASDPVAGEVGVGFWWFRVGRFDVVF